MLNEPTNAQIMHEIDELHYGWTDTAIMLDCGDKDIENQIDAYAIEWADLHTDKKTGTVNQTALSEEIAYYMDIYAYDDQIPGIVFELVHKALNP